MTEGVVMVGWRRASAAAAAAALAAGLAACADGVGSLGDEPITVGVAMPARTPARWAAEAQSLRAELENLGYGVTLQYAEGDTVTQANQVRNLLTGGADLLVIAPVDALALTQALEQAALDDVPVIAYDRLVRGTDAVDLYVTFDSYQVGDKIAISLLHGLGLTGLDGIAAPDPPPGPFTIELFAGAPEDSTAMAVYNGVMDRLRVHLDAGTLTVPSGETEFEQVATPGGDPASAQSRMTRLLGQGEAAGGDLDAVLSTSDAMSRGILGALTAFGYGARSRPLPIVTGQDAERESVLSILEGRQYSTVFKDGRDLVRSTATLVDAVLTGGEPAVTDTDTFFNGVLVVPSLVLESELVLADNVRGVLVDSGYYTPAELGLG